MSEIPLSRCADRLLRQLADATGSSGIRVLDGQTLLGERAMLTHLRIPSRISAGGGCHLFDALDDSIALNLSRRDDRELLPALFESDAFDITDDAVIGERVARSQASPLVQRGRMMGLAIAAERECRAAPLNPSVEPAPGLPARPDTRRMPRVIDLSALWAGPLASHLLWLAGAEVIKVESRSRPDAMRDGDREFHALLNQSKASVVLDFNDANDRNALRSLIAGADIVIEAARPRALTQLGIDAVEIVRNTPGLVWTSITAHGAQGESANWVGFGDDCGVAAGLAAELRAATGCAGFVGDAIADPLTGIFSALTAWNAWASRCGGRIGVAMTQVVAQCLQQARSEDAAALHRSLTDWSAAIGRSFPAVTRRAAGPLPALGEHTREYLARIAAC
jgi:hypothetical protein